MMDLAKRELERQHLWRNQPADGSHHNRVNGGRKHFLEKTRRLGANQILDNGHASRRRGVAP
jgi:hypothetical protein